MNLGVQYYRPPFPEEKYWDDDLSRIRDSGLNTIQLWVLWAWVEAKPGRFVFDDYDRLVELAGKNNLGVIMSTIAEIQPYWIHKEVPGSEMIDHMGNKVISSNRGECHFGLTPGGCFDHPGVWERMQQFLTQVASRYRSVSYLRGWDAWNELRWNVQADGLVCFCDYTLKAFRTWLDEKYGGIEGLNKAWKRRYNNFEEVMPGKLPGRPYTEMMAFEHFLTMRACQHARARYDLIKSFYHDRPVTVHGGQPSFLYGGNAKSDHTLNRGNDWFFADYLDGIGCSNFPKWFNVDDADFAVHVEMVRSAARGKRVWLSELQGGRSAIGFNQYQSVDALSQQRWIWNGIACGADTILFWCWRDEVFGRESGGFGLIGLDGFSEERIAAMKSTGKIIKDYCDLLNNYQPDKPEVGLLFSPQTYYLNWAEEGSAGRAINALLGYARGLVRKSIPFTVVEEEHLDILDDIKILFMPHVLVTSKTVEERLERFVREGGTLVCESECGAFSPQGFYRYPEDRFTALLAGIRELGRRKLGSETIPVTINGKTLTIGAVQWLTPWEPKKGTILADGSDGALITEISVGKGKIVLCGAYLGEAYRNQRSEDFEIFVESLVCASGVKAKFEVISPKATAKAALHVRTGKSGDRRMAFVFFQEGQEEAHLGFRAGTFSSNSVKEIISGTELPISETREGQELKINLPKWRFAVLIET